MKLAKALMVLRPNKVFIFNNEDLSSVIWDDPSVVTPSQEEVDAELARQEQEDADKKAAAEAKLQVLGLTAEDLKALLK
jgi:hypothetical protein